jgi:cobyrinic acid a,c-diamide synthase
VTDLPRLLLAAPASGSGKTTATIGLLRVLLDRGLRPTAFKSGPDYIDPLFHREVLDVHGYNLDLFLAGPEIATGLLCAGAAGGDVAIVEGVMGYYDGIGNTDEASSWDLARHTGTPAVLVVRPGGSSLTLAAMLRGLTSFRTGSMLGGVILNGCGERGRDRLVPIIERETGLRVFGHIPEIPAATMPSRHLGLVTPDGIPALRDKVRLLAEGMAATLDVDGLLALARTAPPLEGNLPEVGPVAVPPVPIAVARDAAFCFYYRESLELLERCGAMLVPFSPLADAALPEGVGGIYLGGGYPEMHASALAGNASMREDIRAAIGSGIPVLAECGGFLYLQRTLEDERGGAHPMVGALPGTGRNAGGLRRFGYATLRMRRNTLLGEAGETLRAHEFHYWDSDVPGDACRAAKPAGDGAWDCVVANDVLFAGFPHPYLWSNPDCAGRFVAAAAAYARGRGGKS